MRNLIPIIFLFFSCTNSFQIPLLDTSNVKWNTSKSFFADNDSFRNVQVYNGDGTSIYEYKGTSALSTKLNVMKVMFSLSPKGKLQSLGFKGPVEQLNIVRNSLGKSIFEMECNKKIFVYWKTSSEDIFLTTENSDYRIAMYRLNLDKDDTDETVQVFQGLKHSFEDIQKNGCKSQFAN